MQLEKLDRSTCQGGSGGLSSACAAIARVEALEWDGLLNLVGWNPCPLVCRRPAPASIVLISWIDGKGSSLHASTPSSTLLRAWSLIDDPCPVLIGGRGLDVRLSC